MLIDEIELKSLSLEDSKSLDSLFTEAENKDTVWSCNNNKSPEPDGFSFCFLQNCWDIIMNDVVCFINEFYTNAILSKAIRTSFPDVNFEV